MNVKILKPSLLSFLALVILLVIEIGLFEIFGSYFGFNEYIVYIFIIIAITIFFLYNQSLPQDIITLEPKEKRNSVIGLIAISSIAIIYIFFIWGTITLTKNISFWTELLISLIIIIYLAIHSLILCRKGLVANCVLEFIVSIGIYVGGFLLLGHDGGYFGLLWPFALAILIGYFIVWIMLFLLFKKRVILQNY